MPFSPRDVATGLRFVWRVRGFLRDTITLDQARASLRQRLERREADFLDLARRAIFGRANSPYRALLRQAGCEYEDLARLVNTEGLEQALGLLYRRGVYLMAEEFKGRAAAVRGSATIPVDPAALHNPLTKSYFVGQSSGSRGPRSQILYDLACFRDRAVNTHLVLEACGGAEWAKAAWGVPGIGNVLRFSPFGKPPERWFAQVDPAAPGLHPGYRWSARALHWGGLLSGVRLPRPEYVSLEEPLPIARWLADVLRAGRTPHLELFVSSAVRLCQAALGAGLDIAGSWFLVIGEPTTSARLSAIERAGVRAVPDYGSSEAGGPVGHGCLAPQAPDDIHLFQDVHALVQPGRSATDGPLPPDALLVSSLRASSPLVLLNVSLGDQAEVEQHACGCPLEGLGWSTHLQNIRSFEKLTTGGMTFLDTDVIRVLEEVLPARFGGGPADYQLVEDEGHDGRAELRLLVRPSIGPLDEREVAEVFLSAVGAGSGTERVMGLVWRDADLLRVERREPRITAGGKIQHLHQEHQDPPHPAK